ncbi:cold shock domain-containing protein E1-like isoform X2 [Hydractinia symbiolongicarpus]|nr:cold shock domain-containing protein E1-like isoform X2 [Hydractinia symbiolongicarpus]
MYTNGYYKEQFYYLEEKRILIEIQIKDTINKMNSYKRERNLSMSPHGGINLLSSSPRQQNGKLSGRQRATSSPTPPNGTTYSKKEKGVIEKLLNSYGFVECASTGGRVFFHYSEYDGDPNNLLVGDCLEFSLTNDPRNNKLLAIKLSKLPPGSVVVESVSEEECVGRVEVEPRLTRNGEHPDPSTLGRVSYDKNGEFFFLPFTIHDIEKGEQIRKGDNVLFYVATNKRTGSLKARRIRYIADALKKTKMVQGIISSLKESFGFIERADVVAEIFFHYSEFNGDINEVMIGDDVEFHLQDRQGKEIAVKVKKLPAGTVVFEDISQNRHRGHVIKAINTRALNNSVDGHLTGMIEYQGKTDTHEVLFGDRDTEDDIILQKGDVVEFNVSTDRRDKLQRAVNIKLISVCVKNGQTRDYGVVSSLKDGFGFIKCTDQDLSIFFHFSEVLEQSHIINIGDEVEFTIENDPISRRQHATRIRFLPKGSVTFETVSTKRHVGVIEQVAPERNLKSPSKHNKEQDFGVVKCFLDGKETDIYYRIRDCRPREVPRYRDKVEFVLVTKKANQHQLARDISVLERNERKYQRGYICALKDSYGFIEVETHEREVFFHYSEFDSDSNQLEVGDEVQFVETKKTDKRSAENVTKIMSSTLTDEILPKVYDGVIVRPMRVVDPEQDEYEGLVQVLTNSNNSTTPKPDGGDEKTPQSEQPVYPFSISSLIQKKEALQTGNKVTFQLCIDRVTRKKRAASLSCKRNVVRGKVESIKGQFGFISYDSDDGKSVFFHMSEVQDDHGKDLKPGDDVRFVIVQNHKNAKKSAVRVYRIVDERPEHLTRRRSKRFSESGQSKVIILRQPNGPDGSKGFALNRDADVIKEQLSAIEINSEGEQLSENDIKEEESP